MKWNVWTAAAVAGLAIVGAYGLVSVSIELVFAAVAALAALALAGKSESNGQQ